MATRSLHRVLVKLLSCRAPLPILQRSAYQSLLALDYPAHINVFASNDAPCASLSARTRCLATNAAAREVSSPLEDDEDDLEDDIEEFDDEFVSEDSAGRDIVVGDTEWSKAVYSAVLACLQEPESEDLELYLFRASPDKFVEIRIDKLTNKYGSPSLDDIERLARGVNSKLIESLGEDVAGEIEVGMSSPGADRPVEWHELQRFAEVPLEVTMYSPADRADTASEGITDRGPLTTHIMFVDEILDSAQVVWRLADVKANEPGKGRRLNKKMREQRWTTAPQNIVSMNIHVDL